MKIGNNLKGEPLIWAEMIPEPLMNDRSSSVGVREISKGENRMGQASLSSSIKLDLHV